MDVEGQILAGIMRLHWLAGGIALVVAPLAMATAKGDTWHRRWGRVFFYAMVVLAFSAIFLAVAQPEHFGLAMVAVFSLHLAASGYRSLYLKKLHEGLKPTITDLWLHGTAALFNGSLLIWGLAHLLMGDRNTKAMVVSSFGLLGTVMVAMYLGQFYRRKHDKRDWFFGHMTGFLGGYITTVSAFSAVNFGRWFPWMPVWMLWSWPVLSGVPLILLWMAYYRGRFAKGDRVRNIAKVRIR